jgi:hypothetical protein
MSRRSRPGGWLSVLAVAAAALVSACGVGPQRTLDARNIEARIAAEIASQYQVTPTLISVACPKGTRAKTGQTFSCTATLAGQRLPIDGTVTDSRGHYTLKPTAAVLIPAHLVPMLEARIAADLGAAATVNCGPKPVLVLPAGGTFGCTATVRGQARPVTVTVEDLQGHVRFSLAAA